MITEYLLDTQPGLAKVIASKTGGNTTRFVHDPMGIHSQENPNGDWLHIVKDGLGSVRQVFDEDLSELYAAEYAPYGEVWNSSGTEQTPFAFTGEMLDDNGLQYHRARYLDPSLGVWMSLDPLETANRYSYVNANPVNAVDPSGLVSSGLGIPAFWTASPNWWKKYQWIQAIKSGCMKAGVPTLGQGSKSPSGGVSPLPGLGPNLQPWQQDESSCTNGYCIHGIDDETSLQLAHYGSINCDTLRNPINRVQCKVLRNDYQVLLKHRYDFSGNLVDDPRPNWNPWNIGEVYSGVRKLAESLYNDCSQSSQCSALFDSPQSLFKQVFSRGASSLQGGENHTSFVLTNAGSPVGSAMYTEPSVRNITVYAGGEGFSNCEQAGTCYMIPGTDINLTTRISRYLVSHELLHILGNRVNYEWILHGQYQGDNPSAIANTFYSDRYRLQGVNNWGGFESGTEMLNIWVWRGERPRWPFNSGSPDIGYKDTPEATQIATFISNQLPNWLVTAAG